MSIPLPQHSSPPHSSPHTYTITTTTSTMSVSPPQPSTPSTQPLPPQDSPPLSPLHYSYCSSFPICLFSLSRGNIRRVKHEQYKRLTIIHTIPLRCQRGFPKTDLDIVRLTQNGIKKGQTKHSPSWVMKKNVCFLQAPANVLLYSWAHILKHFVAYTLTLDKAFIEHVRISMGSF